MPSPTTLRRVLRIGAPVLFLGLVGATYQGVATALERRTFPRPGGLVAVGDHQLHIHCTGTGTPTVVLEAPAAGMSAAWGAVQPAVARVTRVCAYDRAGLGWSERGDARYAPEGVVSELHSLLDAAGERGPYVIAGHGLGAAFATLFAAGFKAETAALVLIDSPDGLDRPRVPLLLAGYPRALPWLARTGLLRAWGGLCQMTAGLPEPSAGTLCAFLNRPDHLARAAEELSQWERAMSLAREARTGPGTAVTRLDADGRNRVTFFDSSTSARAADAIVTTVHRVRAAADDGEGLIPAAR